MKIETLLKHAPDWTPGRNTTEGVVLGCIVRMVRNLAGHVFPGWSSAEERKEVASTIIPAIRQIRGFKTAFYAEMSQLAYGERRALLTRKQLTPCMAARQDGCHIVIPQRRPLLIMVNEEEHLVVHSFQDGFNFARGIIELQHLENQLAEHLDFAHTDQHGYLTSIPSEAGDGLQLYCILHLPGLVAANMMSQVTKALEKLHVNISPYFSDAQDDTGHLFVLFSIPGPEYSVEEMLHSYTEVACHLIRRELQVRSKLLVEPGLYLHDAIGRAYGLLTNCRRLSLKELRDALSLLRLGTLQGILQWQEDEHEILVALNRFGQQQATLAALAAENETPDICIERASAARNFLINHPHHFSDTPA